MGKRARTFNAGHRPGRDGVTVDITGVDVRSEDMDIELERRRAEDDRCAVAVEVSATIAALTTLLSRMEAVEALRREARKDTK
jgi:hypothetical protein